jgi:hypothetical protein
MRARRLIVAGSAAIILGGPLLVFACTYGVPPGVVYGFDTPAGGRLVDPSIVVCGGTECDVKFGGVCCAGPGVAGGGDCFDAGASCPPGTGQILCNEKADCLSDQSCCASPPSSAPSSSGYLTATCATSCTATQIQLCRTNGECPRGEPCVIQKCPDGIVYEVCGLSTSPGFACEPSSLDGGLGLDGASDQ